MKDPLFADDSGHPYELLELAPNASVDEINAAYRRGFARPNRVQLRTAHSVLIDPEQRALIGLCDDDNEALKRLPGTVSPATLADGSRVELSRQWWAVQKESFPDLDASHALAVLYFWWANAAEEALVQITQCC